MGQPTVPIQEKGDKRDDHPIRVPAGASALPPQPTQSSNGHEAASIQTSDGGTLTKSLSTIGASAADSQTTGNRTDAGPSNSCVKCGRRKAAVMYMPCLHVLTCQVCVQNLICPVDNVEVTPAGVTMKPRGFPDQDDITETCEVCERGKREEQLMRCGHFCCHECGRDRNVGSRCPVCGQKITFINRHLQLRDQPTAAQGGK